MLDVASIPSEIGHYIAGFADGEGSFNVSFRKRKDYKNPWKVSLCFNISQKDFEILKFIQNILQCGTLRGRPDGVWYFEVNLLGELVANVIPFFKRFTFLSEKKKRDFQKFVELADLIKVGAHLSVEGIGKILVIRSDMNGGGKRKYSDHDILSTLKSSETKRQTAM